MRRLNPFERAWPASISGLCWQRCVFPSDHGNRRRNNSGAAAEGLCGMFRPAARGSGIGRGLSRSKPLFFPQAMGGCKTQLSSIRNKNASKTRG